MARNGTSERVAALRPLFVAFQQSTAEAYIAGLGASLAILSPTETVAGPQEIFTTEIPTRKYFSGHG